MSALLKRLNAIAPQLGRLRRGIEKESLRVGPDGMLAATPHAAALGSALTHPHITTDFSEAQLELITGVHASAEACVAEITQIHQYVYRAIGEELLWGASMPCGLPADDQIPIGHYGRSNIGRAKSVYRVGLGHRYGRRMQTISGIHYNFSLPEAAWARLMQASDAGVPEREFRDATYFSLIRNFRRRSWLLLVLFGASPTVCSTFVAGRRHRLAELKAGTLYLPGATSLRMGPLGYQSEAQATLKVSYNCLNSYAASLKRALEGPYPAYEKIGIRDGDDYRQLSTSLLQIENEFYGTIRPKRPIRPGERPLHALNERGVEYVEVRCMDLNPFLPVGIDEATMRFLDVFLLHCALGDSPPDTPEEIAALARNQHRAADHGRDPGLKLERAGREVPLADWAAEILDECAPIAQALDAVRGGELHRQALAEARAGLADFGRLPSARVLAELGERFDDTFVHFALEHSRAHKRALGALPYPAELAQRFAQLAEDSLAEQKAIEAADRMPFEAFRRAYLAQDLTAGAALESGC